MGSWTIYSKNRTPKYTVKELEYHDTWMGEEYVTVSITSPTPLELAIGDYLVYRGLTYSVYSVPGALKQARKNTYGEAFKYDNVKLSSRGTELTDIRFLDYVLDDNNIHYTSLPTFAFYAETVDDLLDRLQANTDREGVQWLFISPSYNRTMQRYEQGTPAYQEAAQLWEQYFGGSHEDPVYEKTNVNISIDKQSVWDGLAPIKNDFGLNFFSRERAVIVGGEGMPAEHIFRYGKGNGLYQIERVADQDQKVTTKLYAYGSDKNLPIRYYANITRICFAYLYARPSVDSNILYLDFVWNRSYVTGAADSDGKFPVVVSIAGVTYNVKAYPMEVGARTLFTIEASVSLGFVTTSMEIDFVSGIDKDKFPASNVRQESGALPNNMAVQVLMLPGFPQYSLADLCRCTYNGEQTVLEIRKTPSESYNEFMRIEGNHPVTFSNDPLQPYILSGNIDTIGIKEGDVHFVEDNDDNGLKEIYPSIEGMTRGDVEGTSSTERLDEIVSCDVIQDNGVFGEGVKIENFNLVLKDIGFDLKEAFNNAGGNMTISMKDGYCGGRDFTVHNVTANANGTWTLNVERSHDEGLDLWFPYSTNAAIGQTPTADEPYQIRTGDHFVLTEIEIGDTSYIWAAAVKMLRRSITYLLNNDYTRFTYLPKVDEIYMARQHDESQTQADIESLHDTLKSGMLMLFEDEDLDVDGSVFIDSLTIKENGNNGIPTYDVVLRNDKQVGTMQRIQNQINTLSSFVAGGNGGGGGLSVAQIRSLISSYGAGVFLSKLVDDTAQGVITFAKGLVSKARALFEGDVDIQGLLRGSRAQLNTIKSDDFTGDGMADTGWKITNAYNGHSKMTIDELYVRMKAVFESLEIKERKVSGGDLTFTAAANVIVRTDYLDVNKQTLGYDTVKVPWFLENGADFFMTNRQLLDIFSREARIKRSFDGLDDRVKLRIRYVRCYFLAEDGDGNEVYNMWQVGDLVRCQTFNMQKQEREGGVNGRDIPSEDGEHSYIRQQNTFWWRKCVAVDSEPTTIEGRKYHWFDVAYNLYEESRATGNLGHCALGSDIPCAGDNACQFGNTSNPERMNAISIEINGAGNSDAPAIKIYRGIYTFDLKKCWWGGETTRKSMWSPSAGFEVYAPLFKFVTEYGTYREPINRGSWQSIPREKDDYGNSVQYEGDEEPTQMVRKCYYYNQVSHKGSIWLCTMANDDFHWVDAYGRYISDSDYDALSEEQKAQCSHVQNYTTDEPSSDSPNWTLQVEKGDKGESSLPSFVFRRSATKPDTPTGGSYASPKPNGWSDGIPAGTDPIWMTSRIFTTDGKAPQQAAWTTPRLMADTDSFDVEFAKQQPDKQKPKDPSSAPSGVWFDPSEIDEITVKSEEMVWMATRSKGVNSSGVPTWGAWTVVKIKGEDGGFKSRVFCRTNSTPDTPKGGSYTSPYPDPLKQGDITWSDGIPSGTAKIWSSVCTFWADGSKTGWSTPQPESDTQTQDIEFSPSETRPNAPTGNTPYSDHTSEGWYDPNNPNFDRVGRMIWRAERAVRNGVYDGEWVITRIYGEQGDTIRTVSIYRWSTTPITQPPTSKTIPPSGWSLTDSGSHDAKALLYMCWGTAVNGVLNNDGWSGPVRMSGEDGDPGADGKDFEYIYRLATTKDGYGTAPANITKDKSGTQRSAEYIAVTDDFVPQGWNDNPQGIDTSNKYEYCSIREKKNGRWGAFCKPVPWSIYGEKGQDGDGIQYVYKLFDHELTDAERTSNTPARPSSPNSQGEYIPGGWSDDMIGPTAVMQYEYVAVLKRLNGAWNTAFETISVWRTYSERGSNVPYLKNHTTWWARNNDGNNAPSSGWDSRRLMPDSNYKYLWRKDIYEYDANDRGRNLLRGTETPQTISSMTMGSGGYVVFDPYNLRVPFNELGLEVGNAITLSFDWSITNAPSGATVRAGVNNSPLWEFYGVQIRPSAGNSNGHATMTFAITSANIANVNSCAATKIRFRFDGANGMTFVVSNMKLEYGEDVSDWVPAPEDLYREEVSIWSVYGDSPVVTIGDNGNWFIDGHDTGKQAEGKDGTGVEIKGNVDVVFNSQRTGTQKSLEGVSNPSIGDCYIVISNRHLFFYDGTTPFSAGINPKGWKDLGEFKGKDGESSYMHMAWADDIKFENDGVTVKSAEGFIRVYDGKPHAWIGFYTDNTETDSTDPKAYKWNYVKGMDGDGYEYVYYRTTKNVTPVLNESVVDSNGHSKTDDEYLPRVTNGGSIGGDSKGNIYEVWDDPQGISEEKPFEWEAVRKRKDGKWGAFSAMTLHRNWANDGQSSFMSHVFKRSASKPDTPTGGSYTSPVPSGWEDGVPDGTLPVWMSTRIFSNNGKAPQQTAWTTPRQMTDTANFDVEFSSVASPNPPAGHPNTNTQWSNNSDSSTIWMATSECHNGVWSNWKVVKIKGEKGNDSTVPGPAGKDGWMITANPANVIITQSLGTDTTSFSTQAVTFSAKKGNNDATVTSVLINNTTDSKTKWYRFNGSVSGTTVTVSSPQPSVDSYYTEGYFTARVTVTDPDSNSPISFHITVPCYANLLGTWKESVENGVKTVIADEVDYDYLDGVLTKNGRTYSQTASAAGNYETWSTQADTVNGSKANMIKKTTTAQQTADGISTKVSAITAEVSGQTVLKESQVTQYADKITASVTDGLTNTGIDIEHGKINLQADKVIISNDLIVPTVISENDDMRTTIQAGKLKIESKKNSSYGIFEINSLNEIVLQMFDKDGKCVINLGGTPNALVSGKWENMEMRMLTSTELQNPSKANLTANAVRSSFKPCTMYYRLVLGKLKNSDNVLEYFLPDGTKTEDTTIINLDGCVFTAKSNTPNIIKQLGKISGHFVKRNNGMFRSTMIEVIEEDTQYEEDVYYYVSGKVNKILKKMFSN